MRPGERGRERVYRIKNENDSRKQRWRAEQRVGLRDGRTRTVTARGVSRQDALDNLRTNVKRASVTSPAIRKMTLEQRVEAWLAEKEPHVRPSSIATYRKDLAYATKALGRRPFTEITTAEFQALLQSLHARGRSPTADKVRRTLRQMYSHAVRDGHMAISPLEHVRKARAPKKKRTIWTVDQTLAFYAHATKPGVSRYADLFVLVMFTGIRLGEALGLQWRHVGNEFSTITIERTYSSKHLSPPKTESSGRTIPVGPEAREALIRMRRRYEGERRRTGYVEESLVCGSRRGTYVVPRNVTRAFQNLCDGAEVPRIRIHDLRVICASFLMRAGHAPAAVQAVLGHATSATSMDVYTKVFPDHVASVALELADVLAPPESRGKE